MYKLIFYVPIVSSEAVKDAIFATGAGHIGAYSHCSWQTEGMGQFKPLTGSNPAIGKHNEIERLPELRVEILCLEKHVKPAISAMKNAHPYEEVAFEVISIENQRFS